MPQMLAPSALSVPGPRRARHSTFPAGPLAGPCRCIEVEGCRVLHRRIVNGGEREFLDILLDHDEAPELTREKVVAITEGARVGRLAADHRGALEWILANVDHRGHIRGGFF